MKLRRRQKRRRKEMKEKTNEKTKGNGYNEEMKEKKE